MKLGKIISRHARYRPDHYGVIFEKHRLTWAEFDQRVNRLSNALLGLGIEKGEKVATLLPNSIELIDTYWMAAKAGIVIVPLNYLLRGKGLSTLLNDSDTVCVITTKSMVEFLEPIREDVPDVRHWIVIDDPNIPDYLDYQALVDNASADEPPELGVDYDDLYNIIYSSGTTGLPKGIMHSHRVRMHYCWSFSTAYRIAPESVILHTGALIFNGAWLTFAPAFYHGTKFILHPAFDVERMIETVEKEQVTHIMMVPSQIVALLHSPSFKPEKMQSLEMILTVGAPLLVEHKQELNRKLPDVFYELYGLTEGFMTILDKDMYADKPESVGVPLPLADMKIVDAHGQEVPTGEVGEIIGRDPSQMMGYYKRPDLTKNAIRDGWLYSGDLGYVDDDGFLYLVDRKKDMIISGGVNVYPRDIEEIIVQHPDVLEAAVFGIPDERWGETPVAAVVIDEEAKRDAEEFRDWINERVHARYQKVSQVIFYDEFPRSVAGKTLKRVMRDEYRDEE